MAGSCKAHMRWYSWRLTRSWLAARRASEGDNFGYFFLKHSTTSALAAKFKEAALSRRTFTEARLSLSDRSGKGLVEWPTHSGSPVACLLCPLGRRDPSRCWSGTGRGIPSCRLGQLCLNRRGQGQGLDPLTRTPAADPQGDQEISMGPRQVVQGVGSSDSEPADSLGGERSERPR